MSQSVIIRHPDGREYAVTVEAYQDGKDGDYEGFEIVSNEDGSAYEAPVATDTPAPAKKQA